MEEININVGDYFRASNIDRTTGETIKEWIVLIKSVGSRIIATDLRVYNMNPNFNSEISWLCNCIYREHGRTYYYNTYSGAYVEFKKITKEEANNLSKPTERYY